MTSLAGQAAHGSGRLLRALAQAASALLLVLLIAAAGLAWRLAQGPLDAPWLARRIERAAAAHGLTVRIGAASLAWSGFRDGGAPPLQVRLSDIRADGPTPAQVGGAQLSFPLAGLVEGHLAPAAIDLSGVHVSLKREADGSVAGAGPGSTAADPAALTARLGALRHVRVRGADVTLDDRRLGITTTLAPVDLDLARDPRGGVVGQLSLLAHAGDQSAKLTASAQPSPDGRATDLRVALSAIDPAALVGLSAVLAPGAALHAPVTLSGRAELGPDLTPSRFHVDIAVGAGTVHAGHGTAPLASATATLDGTLLAVTATLRLVTAARPDRPTSFAGHAEAARNAGGIDATATLAVDRLDVADLAAEWPTGIGGPGTRPWITENITAGAVSDGRLTLALHAPADLSDVTLKAIDGALDGHDLRVSWLKPVPPVEHLDGRLTVTDADVIEIATESGVQAGGTEGGVRLGRGHVRLTGIAGDHQLATIDADLAGPLADLLRTLRHPRLKLLDRQKVTLRDPAGTLAGHLTVAHLPLEEKVSLDDIAISARARLTGVHLGGVVAGRDVDRGTLDATASNDGLSIAGSAQLAHIPVQARVEMDFRSGPPSQVTQRAHVTAVVTDRQLASLQLPAQGFLAGDSGVTVDARVQRGGRADVVVDADLAAATITASRLGYAKPAGAPAQAHVAIRLDHDALASVSEVRLLGRDVDVEGEAQFAAGRPDVLQFDRVRLGLTDLHGSLRLPHGPRRGYDVKLSGPSLDLSGLVDASGRAPKANAVDGTSLALDLRLGRVLFSPGHSIERVAVAAERRGGNLIRASVSGGVGAGQFTATVQPVAGGRRLDVSADDFGRVLHDAGVWDGLRGGRLRVEGAWDEASPNPRLDGRAVLERFRVLDAPVIGRILKAATLYGVIDLLRGPGLGFARLEAPFRYADGLLDLQDAGVFSPSLGATAHGRLDLAARRGDVAGTVVPAYLFNALPGRLPLVGHLFSPERNGGVFAATYSVRGALADPVIAVNPAAALAPGIVRRLFGLSTAAQP